MLQFLHPKKNPEILTALHYKPLYNINRSENGVKNVQTEWQAYCSSILYSYCTPTYSLSGLCQSKKCQNPFKDAKSDIFDLDNIDPTACRYYLIILATLMAMTPTLLTQFLA